MLLVSYAFKHPDRVPILILNHPIQVETMAVNENPLETRESLVALLSNRYFSNNSLGNIGKQFDDAMKFLEEVRLGFPMF